MLDSRFPKERTSFHPLIHHLQLIIMSNFPLQGSPTRNSLSTATLYLIASHILQNQDLSQQRLIPKLAQVHKALLQLKLGSYNIKSIFDKPKSQQLPTRTASTKVLSNPYKFEFASPSSTRVFIRDRVGSQSVSHFTPNVFDHSRKSSDTDPSVALKSYLILKVD